MSGELLMMRIRVGFRFTAVMSVQIADITKGSAISTQVEWSPKVPKRLSPNEIADYRRGRDAFMSEVARLIGGRALIVEPGGLSTLIEPAAASTDRPS